MVPRRATSVDVEAIKALVDEAYGPWVAIIGHKPTPMMADYAKAVASHVIDLHHVGGELAALIEMKAEPDHLLIVNLAVSPAFQGRGFGRDLLAHAERVAARLGFEEMRLYTNRLMTKNIDLYRRLGYRLSHEEGFMGGVIVHMRKSP